jgi:chaperonin GroES
VIDSIQPLGARVLIEIIEEEGVTASGLVIPDTAKEKQQKGIVAAVGDDEDTITVKVGERVLFPKYSGTEIAQNGHEYLIIDATELLAVLGRSAS